MSRADSPSPSQAGEPVLVNTPPSKGKLWRLFGLNLLTDFPFSSKLLPGTSPHDLSFTCVASAPPAETLRHLPPAYTSPHKTAIGESIAHLYRLAHCDLLSITGMADYVIGPDAITCYPVTDHASQIEALFLGPVMSVWLELQGILTLHASTIVSEGKAVGFLSHSGSGKSTLTAALLETGCALLTDDILAVEERDGIVIGRPSYPQIRLWPDEATRFLGDPQTLDRVHPASPKRRVPVGENGFGSYHDSPLPVVRLYVPTLCDPATGTVDVEIDPLAPRDAIIEIVRHSFSARIVRALGLEAQRLDTIAQIAQQIRVCRLTYPSGLEHLPRVRDAILEDIRTTSASL